MSSMGVMGIWTLESLPREYFSPTSDALRNHGAQLEALEPLLLARLHQPVDAVVGGVAVGAPNRAINPSPMYLSSVPPCAKMMSDMAVK